MKLRNKIFVISRVFRTSGYFIQGFKIHKPVVSSSFSDYLEKKILLNFK